MPDDRSYSNVGQMASFQCEMGKVILPPKSDNGSLLKPLTSVPIRCTKSNNNDTVNGNWTRIDEMNITTISCVDGKWFEKL